MKTPLSMVGRERSIDIRKIKNSPSFGDIEMSLFTRNKHNPLSSKLVEDIPPLDI